MDNLLLDKEIEIDRINNLSKNSMFFNEADENDLKRINQTQNKSIANKLSSRSKEAILKGKKIVRNMKKLQYSNKQDELIYGYGNSIHSLIKLGLQGGVCVAALNPVLGAIAFVTSKALTKNAKLVERKRLYNQFYSDLKVIEEKIKDIDNKGDLSDKDKEEKYALMKMKTKLVGSMSSLEGQIKNGK